LVRQREQVSLKGGDHRKRVSQRIFQGTRLTLTDKQSTRSEASTSEAVQIEVAPGRRVGIEEDLKPPVQNITL
jgi:hypothetical protein